MGFSKQQQLSAVVSAYKTDVPGRIDYRGKGPDGNAGRPAVCQYYRLVRRPVHQGTVTFDNSAEASADAQAVIAPALDPYHFGPRTPGKRATRVGEPKCWHFIRGLREQLCHGTLSVFVWSCSLKWRRWVMN